MIIKTINSEIDKTHEIEHDYHNEHIQYELIELHCNQYAIQSNKQQ